LDALAVIRGVARDKSRWVWGHVRKFWIAYIVACAF